MKHENIAFADLKESIRTASSRRFGVSKLRFELLAFVVSGVFVAGLVYSASGAQPIETRLIAMAAAVVSQLSVLSVYRMAVPFLLRISYANMLRIRWPFYIWLYSVFLLVCLSDSFFEVFTCPNEAMLRVLLVIVVVGQVFAYFRAGKLRHVFLAAALTGYSIGLSAFGICTFFLGLMISLLVSRDLLLEFEKGDWVTEDSSYRILNRAFNQSSKNMERMLSVVFALIGMAVAAASRYSGSWAPSNIFNRTWIADLVPDGIIVFVAVGVTPLLFALSRIRQATDDLAPFTFAKQVKYTSVGCMAAGILFQGEMIFDKMRLPFAADARYWFLGMTFAGMALLLSLSVAVFDLWCRAPTNACINGLPKGNWMTRSCRMIVIVLPLILLLVRVFMRFHFHA